MLELQTGIEGKQAHFGPTMESIRDLGYKLGGGWDYDGGCFDSVLWREGGETIYLRIPFHVSHGELDHYNTSIVFRTPYVIKHVVNVGLDRNASSLTTATFNQFQDPIDKDAEIRDKSKWEEAGEQAVEEVITLLQ
ncbi:hypothetical protein HNO89_003382 [Sporosarcina luteola]|nr:hypothetical protein [Sporosarcina luteola]